MSSSHFRGVQMSQPTLVLVLIVHSYVLSPRFQAVSVRTSQRRCLKYHLTFEITYSVFILGEFSFVIISAKITVQNPARNCF